jgi:hypothetical protein
VEKSGMTRLPIIRFTIIWILSFSLALTVFQKELNTNGDNGAFLIFAKSLAEGKGFRLISYPEAPKSDQFPILFPLFLSFFIRIFGFKIILLKLVMTATFATTIAVFDRIVSRLLHAKLSIALLILVATNYWILDSSSIHMSEMPFLCLTLASLWCLMRFEQSEKKPYLYFALFGFAISPFVRTVGLAAVGTAFLYLFFKRYFRQMIFLAATFIVFWIVNRLSMQSTTSYFSTLFLKNPYRVDLGAATAGEFVNRLYENIIFYSTHTIRMTLLAFMSEENTAPDGGTFAGALLFIALLLFYPLKKLKTENFNAVVRVYLLLYLGILISWPQVWSGSRFLTPIIPLLLLVAFQNGNYILDNFIKKEIHGRLFSFILFASILWSVFNYSSIYRKVHEPLGSDWQDFFKTAEWAKTNIPDTAVVCARSPFLFYIKSGRYCRSVATRPNHEDMIRYLDSGSIDYVVVDRFKWTGTSQAYMVPTINSYPDRFKSIFELPDAVVYKYSVNQQ